MNQSHLTLQKILTSLKIVALISLLSFQASADIIARGGAGGAGGFNGPGQPGQPGEVVRDSRPLSGESDEIDRVRASFEQDFGASARDDIGARPGDGASLPGAPGGRAGRSGREQELADLKASQKKVNTPPKPVAKVDTKSDPKIEQKKKDFETAVLTCVKAGQSVKSCVHNNIANLPMSCEETRSSSPVIKAAQIAR